MQLMKLMWAVIALLLVAALTACSAGQTPEPTQDVNAVYTSVAGTMIAQLNDQQTQTAQAVPPTALASPTPQDTSTPLPILPTTPLETPITINTPAGAAAPTFSTGPGTPGSTAAGCADATFVSESGPNDGAQFRPGENFSKSWTFKNTGTCTWTNSYGFGFQSGDRLGSKNVLISRSVDFVSPGQTKTFTVNFEAPRSPGQYIGYWQMRTDTGGSFGSRVWIDIEVKK